jgi:hypothetical protein
MVARGGAKIREHSGILCSRADAAAHHPFLRWSPARERWETHPSAAVAAEAAAAAAEAAGAGAHAPGPAASAAAAAP